jgi:hypothetical protein
MLTFLFTKVACLLEAKELLQGVRNERRSVCDAHELQKRIWCYGSPTGIL